MGMFDEYIPEPPLHCPACGEELSGWQGKDGPCLLLVWRQGSPHPAVPVDDELVADEDSEGLPASFRIHTFDAHSHWVDAECVALDGVWTETRIVSWHDMRA